MEPNAFISVVIPCYNQARYLPEALASVQAQTFQDWECIIVNDGSPDNTADVAREWVKKDSRFCYIEKSNGGLSSARNRGLLEARGDYIQLLDADDLIEPAKFSWQVNLLRGRPDLGVVYSDLRYFPTNAPQLRRFTISDPDEQWMTNAWLETRPFLDKLLERNLMAVNCPLIRRSVVNRVGLFSEILFAMEDWHYWLRCAALGTAFHFAPAPDTLALVRLHPDSMSRDWTRLQRATFEMTVLIGPMLEDPKLRRKNFNHGVGRMPAHSRGLVDHQLLRWAWANRGLNVIRPFIKAYFRRLRWVSKTPLVSDAGG